MFIQTKSWPNTLSKVFIVLIITWVLLIGIGQAVEGQTALPSPAAPPGATSKTTDGTFSDADIDDSQQAQPPSDEKKPTAIGKWDQRYEKFLEGINEESPGYEDADAFYQELNVALRDMRMHFKELLGDLTIDLPRPSRVSPAKTDSKSPKENAAEQEPKSKDSLSQTAETRDDKFRIIEQLQLELTSLYNIRTQMLQQVSPGLRSMVTGTGVDGVQAFKGEIEFLVLKFRTLLYFLPQVSLRVAGEMLSAPAPVFLIVVKLAVVFLALFWWRRWAADVLPRVRNNILDTKPLQPTHKWLAKLLWYLIRVRQPLEWIIFLWMLHYIIGTSGGQSIFDFLWTKAKWILSAWFAVAFFGAMFTRKVRGLKKNTINLRLRSIRVIVSWVVITGLGLSITEDLVGKGTIYAWVWIFSKMLALPMLFLLVRWWRAEIYLELEEVSHKPAYIQKILQHKRGLRSFIGTAVGAIYLIVNGFRQWTLRAVTAFEGGRYLIANLTRLEAMRVSERKLQKIEGDPISDEMRQRLYTDEGGLVESIGQGPLERMINLVEQRQRGMAGIVAEQGGGKTHLLKRLDSRFEGKMIFFDCPSGGLETFQKDFSQTIGLSVSDLTAEAISARLQESKIRVIGIDNVHRLSRPAFGGQRDMDQLADLVSSLQADVFWFYGVNWAAWHYISRVRESQLFLDEVLRIPLWSEEQIRELIELRSAYAGIEPDFSELLLPRQFEDIDYDTIKERNRFGFYRILWNTSDGNPLVSLQLWADSLRIAPDGRFLVSLPQFPATSELEKTNMTVLLTLRVIMQSEVASLEEINNSLRFPTSEVAGALHMAITHEWVEPVNGRYRLTRKWFRSITRVLARKNLLARTTLGGNPW